VILKVRCRARSSKLKGLKGKNILITGASTGIGEAGYITSQTIFVDRGLDTLPFF
jgi:hypothetical protein